MKRPHIDLSAPSRRRSTISAPRPPSARPPSRRAANKTPSSADWKSWQSASRAEPTTTRLGRRSKPRYRPRMVEAAANGRLKDQAKTLATVLFLIAGGLISLVFGEGWVRIGGTAIGFVVALGIFVQYSGTVQRVVLEGEALRVDLGFGLRRVALPLSELSEITLGSPDGSVADIAVLRFGGSQILMSPAFFPAARALVTQLIGKVTLGVEVPLRAGPARLMGFQRFSQEELNSSLSYSMPSGAATIYVYLRSPHSRASRPGTSRPTDAGVVFSLGPSAFSLAAPAARWRHIVCSPRFHAPNAHLHDPHLRSSRVDDRCGRGSAHPRPPRTCQRRSA